MTITIYLFMKLTKRIGKQVVIDAVSLIYDGVKNENPKNGYNWHYAVGTITTH